VGLGALWLAVVVAQAVGLAHGLVHPHGVAPAMPALFTHGHPPSTCAEARTSGSATATPGVLWCALADSHDEGEALCLLLDQLAGAEGIETAASSLGEPQGERSSDRRPISAAREPGCAAYLARAPPTA
jgi:hypothetical protein